MPIEIERKFLVKKDLWYKIAPYKTVFIRQVYLSTDPNKTVRIRSEDNHGYIAIKGKALGIVRSEYEYEIPLVDANELIKKYSINKIEKNRHYVTFKNMKWEVDEFLDKNSGLFIAEIELKAEDQQFEKPEWIGEEITFDKRFYNSYLSIHPFNTQLL